MFEKHTRYRPVGHQRAIRKVQDIYQLSRVELVGSIPSSGDVLVSLGMVYFHRAYNVVTSFNKASKQRLLFQALYTSLSAHFARHEAALQFYLSSITPDSRIGSSLRHINITIVITIAPLLMCLLCGLSPLQTLLNPFVISFVSPFLELHSNSPL
jgi:hypothetical protein